MSNISDNIKSLREEIDKICLSCGRKDRVSLVAATKTRTPEEIAEAISAGIDAAGENRAQEFDRKYNLGAYVGTTAHFIGHLQTNKVNLVVGRAVLIQSVDSTHLLSAIDRRAASLGTVQDVLAEINIGGEEAKSGMAPEELPEFMEKASNLTNIRVLGLMTVAPATTETDKRRSFFTKMYKLFIDNQSVTYDNINLEYLSMGMTGDFHEALMEGANMIRIGTGIFGPRT